MQAETNINGVYVALESADNTGGANGDKEIQVAGPGSHVIVTMGGAVDPGALIKVNASSQAIAGVAGDVEADLLVGRYLRHPGETKATRSAANDLGIIVLGAGV
jgi:hypothetical protein